MKNFRVARDAKRSSLKYVESLQPCLRSDADRYESMWSEFLAQQIS
jgi:hypothetical protein